MFALTLSRLAKISMATLLAAGLFAATPAPEMPDAMPTCGLPQQISPATALGGAHYYASSVVWNGSDYAVAWADYNNTGLKFRRFYSDGTPAAATVAVEPGADPTYGNPRMVWNGAGYGVTWGAWVSSYLQVFFARLNPDGSLIGAPLRISMAGATPTAHSYSSDIAWSGSGYAVVWQDYRTGATTGYDIFATELDGTGNIAGAGIRHDLFVTNMAVDEYNPAIAWSSVSGLYALVWERYNSSIPGARFAPLGAIAANGLIVTSTGTALNPRLATSDSGFGLTWSDSRDGNAEIYFARLDDRGSKLGSDLRVTNDLGSSLSPQAVWTGAEFGIFWQDNRGGTGNALWFQRVSALGALLGGNVPLSAPGYINPAAAFGGHGYLLEGRNSASASGLIIPVGCGSDGTPPTCPANFLAYNITGTSASVSWSPSGDPETDLAYYQVYRNNVVIGKTSSTYYNDSGLPLSSTNNYMIQPVNAWQLQNTACTSSIYVKTNATLTLTMNKSNPDAVLNWTDAYFNNYNIFRGTRPQVMGQIGTTPALTSQDPNVLNDTVSYFYSVDNPGP